MGNGDYFDKDFINSNLEEALIEINQEKEPIIKSSMRSVRNFTKKEIPDSDLQVILKASVRATNTGGRQNYSIIIIDDATLLKKLFYSANRALVFCVDFNRIADSAARLGYQYDTGGIMEFFTGSTDAISDFINIINSSST